MPDVDRVWTHEEVRALPDDGNRYELIDGQLVVSPSPRAAHQLVLAELFKLVPAYAIIAARRTSARSQGTR